MVNNKQIVSVSGGKDSRSMKKEVDYDNNPKKRTGKLRGYSIW